jgi:NADH-quinone oxidoreductase subunit N
MDIQIPSIDMTLVLQMTIVFGWATILLLIDLFVPENQKRITGFLAIVGLIAAIVAGAFTWGQVDTGFSGMIKLDTYAIVFNSLFCAIGIVTILLSLDYLPRQGIERGEYYVLLLIAIGGMMVLAQAADLIVVFVGLELLSITLYILVGFAYPRLTSQEAAMKYLIIGAFAAGFLVFGIALVYGATGTSNLNEIAAKVGTFDAMLLSTEDFLLLMTGAALLVVGLGYKIAVAPFHMWTPDVYEGSPTPVTAFMSVGTKAAGFAALIRVLTDALPGVSTIWVPALAFLAALTIIVGYAAAVVQTNVKRMLAYSSIGHAGFILIGVLATGSATTLMRGVESVLFYLMTYTVTNLAAFGVLIALEKRAEAAWDLSDFNGLFARNRWLAVMMAICMLSLAGVPPLAGFWGKFFAFGAAWQSGNQWVGIVGVIMSGLAAFFYLRIVVRMFMVDPGHEQAPPMSATVGFGAAVACLLVVLLGLLPGPVITLVQQAAQQLASR